MILAFETAYSGTTGKLLVKRLRTDNGKEFNNKALRDWLKKKGIKHELSAPYSTESNRKAERLNRTILDIARTLLYNSKRISKYKKLWAEFFNTADWIRNRLYTSANNESGKTPYEIMYDKKPDLSHLRKIGSRAYVRVPKQNTNGKFEDRARLGYLVGYDSGNSYRIILPDSNKVIVSRDVKIDENWTLESVEDCNSSSNEMREVAIDLNDTTTSESTNSEPIRDDDVEEEELFEDAVNGDHTEETTYYSGVR